MTEEQKKKCAELWIENEKEMQNYCKSKLRGCEPEIEEALAELQLALCNQIVKRDFPNETRPWLYKTLKNIISHKFRDKYKREEHIIDIDSTLIELPYQNDFVETIEINEQIKEAEKLIPTLKPNEQEILHNTYFSEDKQTMKKLAEKLGSTETAVKQTRYRVCRNMQKKLNKF